MTKFWCVLSRTFTSIDEDGYGTDYQTRISKSFQAWDRSDAKIQFVQYIRSDPRYRGLWWISIWKKNPFKGIKVKRIDI